MLLSRRELEYVNERIYEFMEITGDNVVCRDVQIAQEEYSCFTEIDSFLYCILEYRTLGEWTK